MCVKIKLKELRTLIQNVLIENGGAWCRGSQPVGRDPGIPDIVNREQLGSTETGNGPDDEDITAHLADENIEDDDPWGPVPPGAWDPSMPAAGPTSDPLARDYGIMGRWPSRR